MENELFRIIEVEINHGCNMACHYCPVSIDDRIEKGHISKEVYGKILSDLKEMQFAGRMAHCFYNEPLLSNQLDYCISEARRELPQMAIDLYSNGTRLTTERFRSLVKIGVTKFIITKHADVGGSYVFDKTFSELSDEEKKCVVYRAYSDINLTNRGGLMKNIGSEEKTTFMTCLLPEQRMTVTLKGNVVVCSEDYYQKNQMGNIMENSLSDIWNSSEYVSFRSNLRKGLRHKYEVCKDCNRWEVL